MRFFVKKSFARLENLPIDLAAVAVLCYDIREGFMLDPLVTPLPAKAPHDERRDRRYPLHLKVQYQFLEAATVRWNGSGRTVDISSRGVLFESDGPMLDRGKIILELDWPCFVGWGPPFEDRHPRQDCSTRGKKNGSEV